MGRIYTIPSCHPDREHWAKGLCLQCYCILNRDRQNENRRRCRQQNIQHHRDYKRSFKYNITLERYEEMWAEQGGRCIICYNPMFRIKSDKSNAAVIDHDHKCCTSKKSCGKCVRGILCSDCNRGLGSFRDDPVVLLNAIEYLLKGTPDAG